MPVPCRYGEGGSQCPNWAVQAGRCVRHGAIAARCSHTGCTNRYVAQGLCLRHGAQPPTCNVTGCTKLRKRKGLCKRHNEEKYRDWKTCSHEGCTRQSRQGGVCLLHGAIPKLPCKHPGCTNRQIGSKQGLCWRHGPKKGQRRSASTSLGRGIHRGRTSADSRTRSLITASTWNPLLPSVPQNSKLSSTIGDVGYVFRKEFNEGWFTGIVVKIMKDGDRRCEYSDGDVEDLLLDDLVQLAKLDPNNNTMELRKSSAAGSNISPTLSSSSTLKKNMKVIGDVGYVFRKEFNEGWFTGTVVKIMEDGDCRCEYSDGDVEDLLLDDLVQLAKLDPNNNTMELGGIKISHKKKTHAIGDVGYLFRKEFANGWFTGTVVKIFKDGDRRCKYSDGDVEDLSLADLKRLSRLDLNVQRLGTTDNNLSNKLEPQNGLSTHIDVDDDSSNDGLYDVNSEGLFDSDSSDDESEYEPSLRIGNNHGSVEAGAKDVLAFNLESDVEFNDADDDNPVSDEMSNSNNVQSNDEDKEDAWILRSNRFKCNKYWQL